jgi:hypothetical protein
MTNSPTLNHCVNPFRSPPGTTQHNMLLVASSSMTKPSLPLSGNKW